MSDRLPSITAKKALKKLKLAYDILLVINLPKKIPRLIAIKPKIGLPNQYKIDHCFCPCKSKLIASNS